MTLEIQPPLETAFQEVDRPGERLDEFAVRDRLVRVMLDLGTPTPGQRKGNFALVGALDFQHRRMHAAPVWEMHWQPMSTGIDAAGKHHHSPDAMLADDKVIEQWSERASAARHPLLRARYADLAWEITRFCRSELTRRPDVAMARIAIDGYLDAVDTGLTAEDLYAWSQCLRLTPRNLVEPPECVPRITGFAIGPKPEQETLRALDPR